MRGWEDVTLEELSHIPSIETRIPLISKKHLKTINLSSQNKKSKYGANMRLEIPLKLPSFNDYIKECRSNKYLGAKMKKEVEEKLSMYIRKLPKFDKPIKINFIWVESTKKRDLDNICFAKKFILDAMQKCGKLENDNINWVVGFTDSFCYGEKNRIILDIEQYSN